jgi:alkaline phosphatase D
MAQTDRLAGDGKAYWSDGWDGYPRARERLLTALSAPDVANPVVLGGDVHMSAVTDLKTNFDDTKARVVATEFVCPSISSQGPSQARTQQFMQENPHIKFADGTRRGYGTVELTAERCVAHVRVVGSAADRDSPIRSLATYTVESGRPGAERV